MRIVQLIDSLNVGGAERIAVNYANALANQIQFSGLVATRKEGALKSQLDESVDYLYLNKKKAIDWRATRRLKAYCKHNQIDIIQAHGTSFFTAFLLKLVLRQIKIVWHEHKGARSNESLAQNPFLWICSRFFSGIIVVDHNLENWCQTVLQFKNVIYLPNFTLFRKIQKNDTALKGEDGKRILQLANLRAPKNHPMLVQVAQKIKAVFPDWSFHLVGADYDDTYSKALKKSIRENGLEETIYIYGLKEDSGTFIERADIAILTSISEGLPVALLEYGLHGKAVVATAVGEIPLILENGRNGFVVTNNDVDGFSEALIALIQDQHLRSEFGGLLYKKVSESHSQEAVIGQYLEWLNKI